MWYKMLMSVLANMDSQYGSTVILHGEDDPTDIGHGDLMTHANHIYMQLVSSACVIRDWQSE